MELATGGVMRDLKDLIERDRDHDCDGVGEAQVCVRVVGVAELPTQIGRFRIVAFWNNRDEKEHVAMVHGDVIGRDDVAVRLHSECLTGDVMGSLRCDCREQLQEGLRRIAKLERGVLLYLRQEGRGIGLVNKIRAYELQDAGMDTVDANLALGFRDDERDYAIAAHMIASLEIRSIQLITNNPDKTEQLVKHGVSVRGRIPHVIAPNRHNRFYLQTKREKFGHHLPEQSDPLVVGRPAKKLAS